jgi:hypothetical protein
MKINNFTAKEAGAPVRFCMIDEKTSRPITQWMDGSFAEVSLEGMKIMAPMSEAEAEMLVGQYVQIKLSFRLPGAGKAIAATGNIVYFLRGSAASKATAITFDISFVTIDYSDRDAIGEFIHQRINSPASNKMHYFQDKKIRDAGMIPQVSCMAHANFAF